MQCQITATISSLVKIQKINLYIHFILYIGIFLYLLVIKYNYKKGLPREDGVVTFHTDLGSRKYDWKWELNPGNLDVTSCFNN